MRLIDADNVEALVRDVRKNLPKDSSDFFTRDNMLLNFEQILNLEPTVDTMDSDVLKSVEEIGGYTPAEIIAMYDDYERMANELEIYEAVGTVEEFATLKEQTRWVPVSERLPDMCGLKCLVLATNKFEQTEVFTAFTGYMEHGKLEFHSCERPYDDLSVWKITHWMPLPEAPEETQL